MEINGKDPRTILNMNLHQIDAQMTQTSKANKAVDESDRAVSDRLELSIRGREIQQMDEMIRSVPDIREARVEQIRSAIESGTYNVKAEKIAEKIIGGNLIDEIF
jgi:negative regulator of flagellin synthesis FlgM